MISCTVCENEKDVYRDSVTDVNMCVECLFKMSRATRCVRCQVEILTSIKGEEWVKDFLKNKEIAKFILGRKDNE